MENAVGCFGVVVGDSLAIVVEFVLFLLLPPELLLVVVLGLELFVLVVFDPGVLVFELLVVREPVKRISIAIFLFDHVGIVSSLQGLVLFGVFEFVLVVV